jgi:hypothetical protein
MGRKEQNKIMPKRIKCKKKISIEKINKDNNQLILSTSLISFNTKKLFSNLYNKKKDINKNLNYSNQNLKINPKININRSIFNNSKKSENNKTKKKDIKNPNLIMQINQLKMIFNLLELHNNKKKTFIYFKKWEKNINEINKNEKTPKSKMENNRENNMMDRNRNLTTKYRIIKYFSPYKKERDYSYKNKNISLYSRDSKDKSRIDYTNDSKINLNKTNYNFSNFKNNNESININMIYKKKLIFDGNRTCRNNISDYSALLECKNIINKHNNDNTNYDKNNNEKNDDINNDISKYNEEMDFNLSNNNDKMYDNNLSQNSSKGNDENNDYI